MVRFKNLLWLLLMASSALGVKALTLETPYDAIAARNVFHLHSAPQAEPPPPKPTPLPKITLTGIVTILGRPMAFITINGIKAGEPPQSLMMVEGQAADGVEVKSIDERAGIVKVLNGGEWQILDFDQPKSSGSQPVESVMVPRPVAMSVPVMSEVPMTAEKQAALIEVQRVQFQQDNNPMGALLPPTDLTPEIHDSEPGIPQ